MAPAGEPASRPAKPVPMLSEDSSPVAVMKWQLTALPHTLLFLAPYFAVSSLNPALATLAGGWPTCYSLTILKSI